MSTYIRASSAGRGRTADSSSQSPSPSSSVSWSLSPCRKYARESCRASGASSPASTASLESDASGRRSSAEPSPSELLTALALGATCLAYGVHLNVAQLVFANTAGNLLSDLIPVPGGIGAAEATLSATLIALGVDHSTAFAIAITQRLCTFYLPPIWGFFSLRWLSRNGYL